MVWSFFKRNKTRRNIVLISTLIIVAFLSSVNPVLAKGKEDLAELVNGSSAQTIEAVQDAQNLIPEFASAIDTLRDIEQTGVDLLGQIINNPDPTKGDFKASLDAVGELKTTLLTSINSALEIIEELEKNGPLDSSIEKAKKQLTLYKIPLLNGLDIISVSLSKQRKPSKEYVDAIIDSIKGIQGIVGGLLKMSIFK
jgi:hypothetical protein